VTNVEGLTVEGGNNYQTTAASGAASVGAPGAGGRGSIEDDTLEQSNVDISTEFANLIVAQRAFEANSKTVTTFDTVTQETINMIH
jgi:flagellar hook protein FlgE